MNKWQEAYSKLKALNDVLKKEKYTFNTMSVIVSVLLMLVEDKLHE